MQKASWSTAKIDKVAQVLHPEYISSESEAADQTNAPAVDEPTEAFPFEWTGVLLAEIVFGTLRLSTRREMPDNKHCLHIMQQLRT